MKTDKASIYDYTRRMIHEVSCFMRQEEKFEGIPTGILELDCALEGGFHNGHIIVIGGVPAIGKSLLAQMFTWKAAVQSGQGVVYFSADDNASVIVSRMYQMNEGAPFHSVNPFDEDVEIQRERIKEVEKQLATTPLIIDDTPMMTVEQIGQKLKQIKKEASVDLIILDSIHGVYSSKEPPGSRRTQLIMDKLRVLSQELYCPIIITSRVSQDITSRDDKLPYIEDLIDARIIARSADVIMLLHRDGYAVPACKRRERPLLFNPI